MLVPKELVAWWVKHHSLRLHVLFNRKNNNNSSKVQFFRDYVISYFYTFWISVRASFLISLQRFKPFARRRISIVLRQISKLSFFTITYYSFLRYFLLKIQATKISFKSASVNFDLAPLPSFLATFSSRVRGGRPFSIYSTSSFPTRVFSLWAEVYSKPALYAALRRETYCKWVKISTLRRSLGCLPILVWNVDSLEWYRRLKNRLPLRAHFQNSSVGPLSTHLTIYS